MKKLLCCFLILCMIPLSALATQTILLSDQGISLDLPADWYTAYLGNGDPDAQAMLKSNNTTLAASSPDRTDVIVLTCAPVSAVDFCRSRWTENFDYLQWLLEGLGKAEALNIAATIYADDLIWFALDTKDSISYQRVYITVQNNILYILEWMSDYFPITEAELALLEKTVRSVEFIKKQAPAVSSMSRYEISDASNGIRLSFELPENTQQSQPQTIDEEYLITFITPQLQQVVIAYQDVSWLFAPVSRSPRRQMTTEAGLGAVMSADFLTSLSISTTDDAIRPLSLDQTSFYTCKGYPVSDSMRGTQLNYAIGIKNGYLFMVALGSMTDSEAAAFFESFCFDQIPE